VLWVEGQVLSPFDGMLPVSDEIRVGFEKINCGDIELTNVYMEKVTENVYVYWSRGGVVGPFVLIVRISKANICEQNKFVLNYKYCVFEFRMWYGLFCYGCLLWVFVMGVCYHVHISELSNHKCSGDLQSVCVCVCILIFITVKTQLLNSLMTIIRQHVSTLWGSLSGLYKELKTI
jgi:hypothetical protein